jgi:SNF2 family DNA or RNA helicase
MLTYHIDKEESHKNKALVVQIKEASGHFLTAEILKKQALTKEDQYAIAFLIEQESEFHKRQGIKNSRASIDYRKVPIGYSQSVKALKLLAATGRLYFNEKPLICDFFSKNEWYYQVDERESAVKITARIKTANQDFSIQECLFLCAGPPHWFIQGISLKCITTEATWQEIKKALEGTLKLSDLHEDPDDPLAPKIVYSFKSLDSIRRKPDPLPVLILKDRTGAFADLWMDYGEGAYLPFDDKEKRRSERNFTSEEGWEKDLLDTGFTKKLVGSSQYYCPLDKTAKSLSFLLELGWHLKDCHGRQVLLISKSDLEVNIAEDSILIKGKVRFNEYEVDAATIAGTFNRKEQFLQLSPNFTGFLPAQSGDTEELNNLFKEGEIVADAVRIRRSQIGILNDFVKNPLFSINTGLAELRNNLQSFSGIEIAEPGSAFQGKLRPYQQEGVNWLSFLHSYKFHGMLADDMGLGKTVQVLAFLSRLKFSHPVLIILPSSLIFNWRKEIEKFLPEFRVLVHHGSTRVKNLHDLEKAQIILTSYTTLRLDLNIFSSVLFECVILDEAQVIKNSHTQIAQAVCQLKAGFRLSLTGTPLENRLSELWSHFHFLIPDLFSSESDFEKELAAGAMDSRFIKRIKKKIRPFILRRKKEEVAKDLPPKIEQVVWTEMAPDQRRIYDDFLTAACGNLLKKVQADGATKHRLEILEAILRLRQICCHPLLVSSLLEEGTPAVSSKLEALLEDLDTVIQEGRKALVYSQFTSMLHLIGQELKSRNWKFAYLDGSTTNREHVVTQFQEDDSVPLFLISLKAGGVGLNLTAADYVFLFDPWWNEAAENQAIDRAHRIGRKDTIVAKRYVTTESIEEKMMTLKAHKRSLVGEILEDEWRSSDLSAEDLSFLLFDQ